MKTHTHKLTIDIPARDVEVSSLDTPNLFPHYEGTEAEMLLIARVLRRAMGRMDEDCRVMSFNTEEIAALKAVRAAYAE